MSRRFLFRVSFALLSAALLHAPAVAQGNSQGHGHGNPHNQDRNQGGVQISFSVHDQGVIRGYYQDHRNNLPPGLAKRGGNLPPGLQKHLERDGTLPPGLQKRIQPFPEDLEARLPRLPTDYHRVILGADIMILDRRTQKIIDIVHDILTL